MKPLRIGFLSTAGIGRKNWKAIYHSGNCVISAVASRDIHKSQEFIRACQALHPFEAPPVALGSYEALVSSPEVDAVYIPLPTGLRKEWVLRAAAAGKHVLCEKPCAVSSADLEEMVSACAQHRRQFMDGVMFMHSPRLTQIRAMPAAWARSAGFPLRLAFMPGRIFSAITSAWTQSWNPPAAWGISAGIASASRFGR